ncbi:MAG: hypothetical protein ABI488_19200 [Polyangiaceae bacterium]
MNRRAVDELAPFYSAKLLFYGQRKSATKVLTAKRLAFEKSPSFQQRVADVHIEKVADGFVVRFEKRSGARLESIVAGRLTLEATGDHLAIVDESDSATDQRFKSPTPSTCGDAVMQIVLSHPAILSDMARVAREYPSLSLGGMTYDEASDRVQSAVGYAHEDHFETRWEVEASGGKLRIQEDGDAPLSITPAQAAVVARLCTGVFPGAGN